MERNIFDPSRVLTASACRATSTGLSAALSIALVTGCIDVNFIRSNIGATDGGLSVGAPCGSNEDCATGFCTDGYCCNEACHGPCTSCGDPGPSYYYSAPAGHCLPVPAGALDPHGICAGSTCVGTVWTPAATCDGAGSCVPGKPNACGSGVCNSKTSSCSCRIDADCGSGIACVNGGCGLQTLGQICARNSECASNQCVEGVCCNSDCSSGCQTCTAEGAVGTCLAVPAGASPRHPADCPVDLPTTCGLDGTCDGSGACRQYFGTTCVAGTCNGNSVTGTFTCDGTGRCLAGPSMVCAPYSCQSGTPTAGCYQLCTSDAQCVAPHSCDLATGSCGPASTAAHCTSDAQCVSGFCADGVCCNIACQGACLACNLPGSMGSCSLIGAGRADPRGVCVDQGASTCGKNGTCDGFGGCANYAPDTECLAPSCVGNLLDTAGSCDGYGTCRSGGVLDCAPFRCVDGACIESCQTDDDCASGSHCVNGSCGAKGLGHGCQSASECASNACVDGVCCDTACGGPCQSCDLPSSPGHCAAVAVNNPDPHGLCIDIGPTFCGTNGECDGSGGCARYPPGTVCASETCAGGAHTPPSSCNSDGQCVAPAPLPCFPYTCDGTQCLSSCVLSEQCQSPAVCIGFAGSNPSCGPKSDGASCSNATECASDVCAQGICCNTACTGACQSCALSDSLGTCSNVPAHFVDQAGLCVDQGASSCGTDGRCDGNGGCEKYLQGTACVPPSCPSGSDSFTAARTCDGAGTCLPPTSISCSPYLCGANGCKTACTADADCDPLSICNSNGACDPSTQTMPSRR